jgi:hypothetical protein
MISITIQDDALKRIARGFAADWSPALRAASGLIATILVAIYAAGYATGERYHRLTRWIQHHQVVGLARLGLPGGTPPMATAPLVVQRQAPAPFTVAPPPLETLSVRELRSIARSQGLRALARSGKRADLLEALDS